jgi:hypothetical protein
MCSVVAIDTRIAAQEISLTRNNKTCGCTIKTMLPNKTIKQE